MGAGNLNSNFSAVPVDPLTGRHYSEYSWITATAQLAASVRALVPGMTLYANGLNSGKKYFAGPRSVRLSTRWTEPRPRLRPCERRRRQRLPQRDPLEVDVDMLVDAEARGKPVLAKTKLWVPATSGRNATSGASSRSRRSCSVRVGGAASPSTVGAPANPKSAATWNRLDLGVPTVAYRKAGGVYQRAWSRGPSS